MGGSKNDTALHKLLQVQANVPDGADEALHGEYLGPAGDKHHVQLSTYITEIGRDGSSSDRNI